MGANQAPGRLEVGMFFSCSDSLAFPQKIWGLFVDAPISARKREETYRKRVT